MRFDYDGPAGSKDGQPAPPQKWRERQRVVRAFFERMAERRTVQGVIVVGVRPPGTQDLDQVTGQEDNDGPLR